MQTRTLLFHLWARAPVLLRLPLKLMIRSHLVKTIQLMVRLMLLYARPVTNMTPMSDRVVLHGNIKYLVATETMQQAGVAAHRELRVLVCLGCNQSFIPNDVPGHAHKKHNVKLLDRESFIQDCERHRIHFDVKDVRLPTPRGPPVEHIPIYDGLACAADPKSCFYCCRSVRTMEKHIRSHHPKRPSIMAHSYRQDVKVQSLFPNIGKQFFEVIPALARVPADNIVTRVLRDYLPSIPPPGVSAPCSDREVTPFLKLMQWGERMKNYRENPDQHVLIKALKSPPHATDSVFQNLHIACQRYINKATNLGHTVGNNLTVRKHLVQGRNLSNGQL